MFVRLEHSHRIPFGPLHTQQVSDVEFDGQTTSPGSEYGFRTNYGGVDLYRQKPDWSDVMS